MEEGKGERYLAPGRQYGNALLGVRHQEEEGPILPRFRNSAGFLLRNETTPTLFHPNLGVFLMDQITRVVVLRSV